ncbi:MAG TPA: histidine phosphatase family protein [Pirellulales bacterium]|jgi:phosphohistidine phosphatase|nr:histidine phosphatase family protein [Pirellulales bacterium]
MLLYLVRHAYAGQHGDPRYPDDELRPLTRKGCKRFRRVIKRLSRRGFEPTIVATSPLVRCRQTAEVICQRISPPPELFELESLKPGSNFEAIVAWSQPHAAEELAWVGHSPDLDSMACALLGAREGSILLAKGAVAAIAFDGPPAAGQGQLRWCVTPKTLGG